MILFRGLTNNFNSVTLMSNYYRISNKEDFNISRLFYKVMSGFVLQLSGLCTNDVKFVLHLNIK